MTLTTQTTINVRLEAALKANPDGWIRVCEAWPRIITPLRAPVANVSVPTCQEGNRILGEEFPGTTYETGLYDGISTLLTDYGFLFWRRYVEYSEWGR